jgi:hypothetical protein
MIAGDGKVDFDAMSIPGMISQPTFLWIAEEARVGAPKGQYRPEIHVSTRTESESVTIVEGRGNRQWTRLTVISEFQIRFGQCTLREPRF